MVMEYQVSPGSEGSPDQQDPRDPSVRLASRAAVVPEDPSVKAVCQAPLDCQVSMFFALEKVKFGQSITVLLMSFACRKC